MGDENAQRYFVRFEVYLTHFERFLRFLKKTLLCASHDKRFGV